MFHPRDIPLQVPRQAESDLRLPTPPAGRVRQLPSGFGSVPPDIPLRVEPDRLPFPFPGNVGQLFDPDRTLEQGPPPANFQAPGTQLQSHPKAGTLEVPSFVSDLDNSGWEVSFGVSTNGGGLLIGEARFLGIPVLQSGAQPFTLIVGEGSAIKDGIGVPVGEPSDGRPYQPLSYFAPNTGLEPLLAGYYREPSQLEDIVHVQSEPKRPAQSPIHQACLVLSARFQAGSRQYIQRWEFCADGRIEPSVGLGGMPETFWGSGPHLVNHYFRIELAFAAGNQVVSKMVGANTGENIGPEAPTWNRVEHPQAILAENLLHTRLRVSDGPLAEGGVFVEDEASAAEYAVPSYAETIESPLHPERTHVPTVPSYEFVPTRYVPPDGFYSTADFFVMDAGPSVIALPPLFAKSFPDGFETLGAAVGATDARDEWLTTYYPAALGYDAHPGQHALGSTALLWPAVRDYWLPRAELNTNAPPLTRHRFRGLDLVPRGVLAKTPPLDWAGEDVDEYLVAGDD